MRLASREVDIKLFTHITLPQRSLCGLHPRVCGVVAVLHHLCLSVACAACIGKYSQNADRTFVDYAVSW